MIIFQTNNLISYNPSVDYRLESLPISEQQLNMNELKFLYYKIMNMKKKDLINFIKENYENELVNLNQKVSSETVLNIKEKILEDLFKENTFSFRTFDINQGRETYKKSKITSYRLLELLGNKLDANTKIKLEDEIFKIYLYEENHDIENKFEIIYEFLSELYKMNNDRIFCPKNDELLILFKQIINRIIFTNSENIDLYAVFCPTFGVDDDYKNLEDDKISNKNIDFIKLLPNIISPFLKDKIPFKLHILINDTEEGMLSKVLLKRLSLDIDTYRKKCLNNVNIIRAFIQKETKLKNINVALFSTYFPKFYKLTENVESQLYKISQSKKELSDEIKNLSQKRMSSHIKINGGSVDEETNIALTIHYIAEYMVFAYLLRKMDIECKNNIIINSNSVNVPFFNRVSLMKDIIKGNGQINCIPIFQLSSI